MSELIIMRCYKKSSFTDELRGIREINPEVQKLFNDGNVIHWQRYPDNKILLEIQSSDNVAQPMDGSVPQKEKEN